ncbi:MAG: hypothetical protein V1685_05465 [Parcubacteria group bacterium]
MNLLPAIITVILIIIAWKWEHIGGWLFIALGIVFIFIGKFESGAILVFMIPLLLIGAMFLWHYYKYVKGVKEPT